MAAGAVLMVAEVEAEAEADFGRTVRLPDPVGIALDTEPLKNWVR
ncbi:hypothetical protein ACFWIQ_16770 [Kitasatospora sp. NPDC127059]